MNSEEKAKVLKELEGIVGERVCIHGPGGYTALHAGHDVPDTEGL